MSLPNDLAAFAVQLRRLDIDVTTGVADSIGRIVVDLTRPPPRDAPVDIAQQMEAVAERLDTIVKTISAMLGDSMRGDVWASRLVLMLRVKSVLRAAAQRMAKEAA